MLNLAGKGDTMKCKVTLRQFETTRPVVAQKASFNVGARAWVLAGLGVFCVLNGASGLSGLSGLSAHAQTVYRIVGADGRVTFSD